jgi:hypothetical protein
MSFICFGQGSWNCTSPGMTQSPVMRRRSTRGPIRVSTVLGMPCAVNALAYDQTPRLHRSPMDSQQPFPNLGDYSEDGGAHIDLMDFLF